MSRIIKTLTQSGADAFTSVAIPTSITSDGKMGLSLTGFAVEWSNGQAAAAGDWLMTAKIATVPTNTTYGDPDEIIRVEWGLQNTGGVAVAVQFEPVKTEIVFEERVTVQPNLYLNISSSATGQANTVNVILYYNTVKLSDLEVLRLLGGGA